MVAVAFKSKDNTNVGWHSIREKKKGERALSLQSARSKVGALGSAFNLVLVAEFSRKILLGGVGAFGYLQSHVHILAKLRAKRGYAYGEISGC